MANAISRPYSVTISWVKNALTGADEEKVDFKGCVADSASTNAMAKKGDCLFASAAYDATKTVAQLKSDCEAAVLAKGTA